MNITLTVDTYKGVDGSSLSSIRCNQIVQVYEMLELLGNKLLTYIDIQEEAQKQQLFGETNAKSAIRTFFPSCLKRYAIFAIRVVLPAPFTPAIK